MSDEAVERIRLEVGLFATAVGCGHITLDDFDDQLVLVVQRIKMIAEGS